MSHYFHKKLRRPVEVPEETSRSQPQSRYAGDEMEVGEVSGSPVHGLQHSFPGLSLAAGAEEGPQPVPPPGLVVLGPGGWRQAAALDEPEPGQWTEEEEELRRLMERAKAEQDLLHRPSHDHHHHHSHSHDTTSQDLHSQDPHYLHQPTLPRPPEPRPALRPSRFGGFGHCSWTFGDRSASFSAGLSGANAEPVTPQRWVPQRPQPVHLPTSQPVHLPTSQPVHLPTSQPVHLPTSQPAYLPTIEPAYLPTSEPLHYEASQPVYYETSHAPPPPHPQHPVYESSLASFTGFPPQAGYCNGLAGEPPMGERQAEFPVPWAASVEPPVACQIGDWTYGPAVEAERAGDGEWLRAWSSRHQRVYFYNERTDESRWTVPSHWEAPPTPPLDPVSPASPGLPLTPAASRQAPKDPRLKRRRQDTPRPSPEAAAHRPPHCEPQPPKAPRLSGRAGRGWGVAAGPGGAEGWALEAGAEAEELRRLGPGARAEVSLAAQVAAAKSLVRSAHAQAAFAAHRRRPRPPLFPGTAPNIAPTPPTNFLSPYPVFASPTH